MNQQRRESVPVMADMLGLPSELSPAAREANTLCTERQTKAARSLCAQSGRQRLPDHSVHRAAGKGCQITLCTERQAKAARSLCAQSGRQRLPDHSVHRAVKAARSLCALSDRQRLPDQSEEQNVVEGQQGAVWTRIAKDRQSWRTLAEGYFPQGNDTA